MMSKAKALSDSPERGRGAPPDLPEGGGVPMRTREDKDSLALP